MTSIRSKSRAPTTASPTAASATAVLDRAIAPLAAELRRVPLFQRMQGGTVAKEHYASLLRSLLTMHRSLERGLASAAHLKGFDAGVFRREEAIARDLHMLGSSLPLRADETLDRFESLVHAWMRPPSAALLGALYAVERERRASLDVVRPLAAALRLGIAPRRGLDYHLDGSDRASRRFSELAAWLAQHVRDPARVAELAEGATQTMQTLAAIHRGVDAPRS